MFMETIFLKRIEQKLDHLICLVTGQKREMQEMTSELTDLIAEVNNAVGLEQSALTMIHGLAAQLDAAAGDATAVKAIADKLRASDAALVEALNSTPAPVGASGTGTATPAPDNTSLTPTPDSTFLPDGNENDGPAHS
jgi:hypothetical protein